MAAEGRFEIEIGDERYPASVRELRDPPKRLYVRGDPAILNLPSISIIGARVATPYGIAVAEMAARVSAQSGLVVVSGAARGCDHAAGMSAMDAGGRHLAVLGCGADVAYPRSSRRLLDRAVERGGAIVSLDPWGSEPRKWAFPRRNRVIAALSEALVVTEAGLPSGTFSTAEAAMELGRELLAVPGSILSPESRGANHLITCGAACIVDEEELEMSISRIYGLLRFSRPDSPGLGDIGDSEGRVIRALTASPLRVDEVASMLGVGAPSALRLLSSMSVRGLVDRLLDGRFAPSGPALHAQSRLGHNR